MLKANTAWHCPLAVDTLQTVVLQYILQLYAMIPMHVLPMRVAQRPAEQCNLFALSTCQPQQQIHLSVHVTVMCLFFFCMPRTARHSLPSLASLACQAAASKVAATSCLALPVPSRQAATFIIDSGFHCQVECNMRYLLSYGSLLQVQVVPAACRQ